MNQYGQSMFEFGGTYTCLLILDTNVAMPDIFKGESKRMPEAEPDVEIST
jgi:hypothetical protein